MRMRLTAACLVAMAGAGFSAGALADGREGARAPRAPAQAAALAPSEIVLTLDTAVPLPLAGPVRGIVLANPSVAGVSVQNERLLFVTARSYGSTSLTVVGDDNAILYHGRVVVAADEAGAVMVTRGATMNRMICTPLCRPQPDIGDDPNGFSRANGQITTRAGVASGGQ